MNALFLFLPGTSLFIIKFSRPKKLVVLIILLNLPTYVQVAFHEITFQDFSSPFVIHRTEIEVIDGNML